jgi:hypothetical protein
VSDELENLSLPELARHRDKEGVAAWLLGAGSLLSLEDLPAYQYALALSLPAAVELRIGRLPRHAAQRFSLECAERVLSLYEAQHPGDERPREALQTARRFVDGHSTQEKLDAARTRVGGCSTDRMPSRAVVEAVYAATDFYYYSFSAYRAKQPGLAAKSAVQALSWHPTEPLAVVQARKLSAQVWHFERLGDYLNQAERLAHGEASEDVESLQARLQRLLRGARRDEAQKFAAECAARALLCYEDEFWGDSRPRHAINLARLAATGRADPAVHQRATEGLRRCPKGSPAAREALAAAQAAFWFSFEGRGATNHAARAAARALAYTASPEEHHSAWREAYQAELRWQCAFLQRLLALAPGEPQP